MRKNKAKDGFCGLVLSAGVLVLGLYGIFYILPLICGFNNVVIVEIASYPSQNGISPFILFATSGPLLTGQKFYLRGLSLNACW